MSRKKGRNRQVLGSMTNIPDAILANAYQRSVTITPQVHHPAIVRGTASRDHLRRDYETWVAGVESCLRDRDLKRFITGEQQMNQSQTQTGVFGDQQGREQGGPFLFEPQQRAGMVGTSLPRNVSDALQTVINNYERFTGRAAA